MIESNPILFTIICVLNLQLLTLKVIMRTSNNLDQNWNFSNTQKGIEKNTTWQG